MCTIDSIFYAPYRFQIFLWYLTDETCPNWRNVCAIVNQRRNVSNFRYFSLFSLLFCSSGSYSSLSLWKCSVISLHCFLQSFLKMTFQIRTWKWEHFSHRYLAYLDQSGVFLMANKSRNHCLCFNHRSVERKSGS